MAELDPDELTNSANGDTSQNEDADLLDSLGDLLAEEGVDLDEEDLFPGGILAADEDSKALPHPPPAPPNSASTKGRRTSPRANRKDRRNRDIEAYKNLDAQIRLTPMGLQVSDDQLVATISRITSEDTFEEITSLLKKNKIKVGIDNEGIRSSLAKARLGNPQYGVEVARGTPPVLINETEIIYHLPKALTKEAHGGKLTSFERLQKMLVGSSPNSFRSWKGLVKVVRKGDVISELSLAEVHPGEDVYGRTVGLEKPDLVRLKSGENTSLSADGTRCLADIYGFAGLIGGEPVVLPPIWMSADYLEARFVYLPSAEPIPPPTDDEFQELLDLKWIEYGIIEEQRAFLQERLGKNMPLPLTLLIARGTRARKGRSSRIEYAFDPTKIIPSKQIQRICELNNPEDIRKSLAQIRKETPELHSAIFRPTETVALKIPPTKGTIGKDIQGEKIAPEKGRDTSFKVGENLTITQDGLRCLSDCFGYANLRFDLQISIFSPLWISPDKTAIYFINLPQNGAPKYPTLTEVQELLSLVGVQHGYDANACAEKLLRLEEGNLNDYLVCLAKGTAPRPGSDAEFEWVIDTEPRRPGKIMDDGSIDYRERNLVTVVKEGDLIGRLLPPTPGISGKDIFGNKIVPPTPINIKVITDFHIDAEPNDDGWLSFYAQNGGGVSTTSEIKVVKNRRHKRINIAINPTSKIESDVDYTTGNIDFNGDVVIGGSVQPQFSVKATGSVTIAGYVEAGAFITAGEDILIKRGVVGSTTELVAGGDVMAMYIQEATVRAGGNVKAVSYIFHASIRTGGQVVVIGKLVGGLIWGARAITARSIGSPYNTGTRLVVGVDPDLVNRAEQIHTNMQSCQEKQRKLMESIDIPSLDVEIIKQKLARTRSAKSKQAILLGVKRIAKFEELEQNLQKELEEIARKQRQLSLQSRVNVVNKLFSGVDLRIGEETLLVTADKERVSFCLLKELEEIKIHEEPFRGVRG